MRRSAVAAAILLPLTLLAGPAAAQEPTSPAGARPSPLVATARGIGAPRVDAGALGRLVEAANAAGSSALVVLHDGDVVGAWHAGGERRRIEAAPVTTMVVYLAVGRLLALGRIPTIDLPVHELDPEWATRLEAPATIRQLLDDDDDDVVAGLVGRAAGVPVHEFLRDELFGRLGITDFAWLPGAAGSPDGGEVLRILPEDLARVGQLILDRGVWRGERLIPETWFEESIGRGSEPGAGSGPMLDRHLVIYPDERLVAVCVVDISRPPGPEADGFADFAERVRELVP